MVVKIKVENRSELNIKANGIAVYREHFKGKYTKAQILKYAQKRSQTQLDNGNQGQYMIVTNYVNSVGWVNGTFANYGEEGTLFDDFYDVEDVGPIDGFQIYWKAVANGGMGATDKYNDCLYKALKKALAGKFPKAKEKAVGAKKGMADKWRSAIAFKIEYLKLERSDKVPLSMLDKIEKDIKANINVTGDIIRTSTAGFYLNINLTLSNDHIELNTEGRVRPKGISKKERELCIYNNSKSEEGKIDIYDGSLKTITVEQFREIDNKPMSSNYVMIKFDSSDRVNNTLESQYNQLLADATDLKAKTDGQINMFKTGGPKTTALALFDAMTQMVLPEPILPDEAQWINKASQGAIVWAEVGYEGVGYKSDINSEYPSVMKSPQVLYPIKRGEFKKITQEDYVNDFGIYRCEVTADKAGKLWKPNKFNYYTSRDLAWIKEIGGEIKLIIDDKPNFLSYTRDKCVTGSQYFGEYVDTLYELKNAGNKTAKSILNVLWGALSEKDMIRKQMKWIPIGDTTTERHEIASDLNIDEIKHVSNNTCTVGMLSNKHPFKTNHARTKPFILANGRIKSAKTILPVEDKVVRIHTDGFICTEPNLFKYGTECGAIKYEGFYENLKLPNKVKVNGEFTKA